MTWRHIKHAPLDGSKILARDSDGFERWTWYDGGWCYEGWIENEDQEEFQCEEYWEPDEFSDA